MTKKELLDSTIEYYSEDVNRRCTNGDACYYNPVSLGKEGISQGCAIGRWMLPSIRKRADGYGLVHALPSHFIPDSLSKLPMSYLADIQTLHDKGEFWNKSGLSKAGTRYVKTLTERWLITE